MATYIPGTDDDDNLAGTLGDDIIDAKDGADVIQDLEGDDVVQPGGGDDLVALGPGRDTVEIRPDERNDMIQGFKSGEDTLKLNGFGDLSYADLELHFRSYDDAVPKVSLDLDAAAGTTNQNLLITGVSGLGEGDIVFANDRLDGGNPDDEVADIDPAGPFDPNRFEVEEPDPSPDIDPTATVDDLVTVPDRSFMSDLMF
jgi:Ca2+-binding RTX toxin-like protein